MSAAAGSTISKTYDSRARPHRRAATPAPEPCLYIYFLAESTTKSLPPASPTNACFPRLCYIGKCRCRLLQHSFLRILTPPRRLLPQPRAINETSMAVASALISPILNIRFSLIAELASSPCIISREAIISRISLSFIGRICHYQHQPRFLSLIAYLL